MKKVLSLILALLLCANLCATAMAAEFIDVPADHAFREAIMDCAEKSIIGGYDDGTFRPANTVVKNHFCAMLARAFYPDQLVKFDTDQYRDTYGSFGPSNVALANSNLLDNTSFQYLWGQSAVMTQGINRYDMAQIMENILKSKSFAVSGSEKTDAQAQIADYGAIPEQYRDAVATVYALGIIGGYSDGTFGGTNVMNRGQAAVVIYRLAQYIGGESGAGPEAPVDSDLTNVPESPAVPR